MNAIELIKYHEKYRRFPYRCTAGKLTIGYGWNLDDNGITVEQATYILDQQVRAVRVTLSAEPYWINLDVVRQAVITDMAFNLGAGGLRKFRRFLAAMRDGQWGAAAAEIRASRYYRQLGGDPAGTDDCRLERPEEIVRMIETGRLVEAKAA